MSLALVAYLVTALVMTGRVSANEKCHGIVIEVNDSLSRRFVTSDEIKRDLGSVYDNAMRSRIADINTDEIERRLMENDRIERARVLKMSDGTVKIEVDPMIPVARVFDGGKSYYINKDGKHMSADARYHINVPVISGHFPDTDTVFTAASVLPLIDYLTADSTLNNLVTMIKVDSPTDIILIPMIRGHVINIGEPVDFESKFTRLSTFYKKIFPVKGWQYYDTVSVKWGGQIVATRRLKALHNNLITADDEREELDMNNMLVGDNVAPGQTLPGRKAHGEKKIPASVNDRPTASNDTAPTPKKSSTPEKKTP